MKNIHSAIERIKYVEIAVRDMDLAISLYRDVFGFEVVAPCALKDGVKSIALNAGGFTIVLLHDSNPDSALSRNIDKVGPGVQCLGIELEQLGPVSECLRAAGLAFATDLIVGADTRHIVSAPDANSGMTFAFLEQHAQGAPAGPRDVASAELEANGAI